MSRSIHTTRRTLQELSKKSFATAEAKEVAADNARTRLDRKRSIKRQVAAERRRDPPPLDGTPLGAIEIQIRDRCEQIWPGASAEDVRAVLQALPGGATEGISRIIFLLGIDDMAARSDGSDAPDPLTGRLSLERFPGVYSGPVLGRYVDETRALFLYSYVIEIDRLPLPRPLCEIYLRLQTLAVLVHELAHHHDYAQRIGRGRWLADSHGAVEHYAEKMEHQWTREFVIPYLESAYASETRALREWVQDRGGIGLPLDFFAGDPRINLRDGVIRLNNPTHGAFELWLAELPTCTNLIESRLAFAEQIHLSDCYAECLEIADSILRQEPPNVAALALKADTLVHLEEYKSALACADTAIQIDPACERAWKTRGDSLECSRDWPALLDHCEKRGAVSEPDPLGRKNLLMHRAVAYCALGMLAEMESAIEACLSLFRFKSDEATQRRAKMIRKQIGQRAGILPNPLESPARR